MELIDQLWFLNMLDTVGMSICMTNPPRFINCYIAEKKQNDLIMVIEVFWRNKVYIIGYIMFSDVIHVQCFFSTCRYLILLKQLNKCLFRPYLYTGPINSSFLIFFNKCDNFYLYMIMRNTKFSQMNGECVHAT